GACTGTSLVVCAASDGCHTVGTCAPATGLCSNPLAPDGQTCAGGAGFCSAGGCLTPVPEGDLGTPGSVSSPGASIPVTVAPTGPGDPSSIAVAYFRSYPALYHLQDPRHEIQAIRVSSDGGPYAALGRTRVRVQQLYQGLPIFGADAMVHLNRDLTVR